jgi:hypothetical protein
MLPAAVLLRVMVEVPGLNVVVTANTDSERLKLPVVQVPTFTVDVDVEEDVRASSCVYVPPGAVIVTAWVNVTPLEVIVWLLLPRHTRPLFPDRVIPVPDIQFP